MIDDNYLVKQTAYELLQQDARYIYALIDIMQNHPEIKNNYVCMSLPYIGLFTDGTEQWFKKVGIDAPSFTLEEKEYYSKLRMAHKALEEGYNAFSTKLMSSLKKSDVYFKGLSPIRSLILGYNNVGVDICDSKYSGNTILIDTYMPELMAGEKYSEDKQKEISVIAGKLVGQCRVYEKPVFQYKTNIICTYNDYHFYKRTPLAKNDSLGFVLFSLLCGVNFVIEFIDGIFTDEIPQKLKYAYLQYYYLCDFLEDMKNQIGLEISMDNRLQDRQFRNCIAHYGLGQYMKEDDIIDSDILKGLTQKAFNKDYFETKEFIYKRLHKLVDDIGTIIF